MTYYIKKVRKLEYIKIHFVFVVVAVVVAVFLVISGKHKLYVFPVYVTEETATQRLLLENINAKTGY